MSTSLEEKPSTPYTQISISLEETAFTSYTHSDSQVVDQFLITNNPKGYTKPFQIESTYSEHLSSISSKTSGISISPDRENTSKHSMTSPNLENWWSMTSFSSSSPSNKGNKLITHLENLQEKGFPKILIFLASVPSCILVSLIIGLMVGCLRKGFRNRRGMQRGSRLRNSIMRERGMMEMTSVVNERNIEGISTNEK